MTEPILVERADGEDEGIVTVVVNRPEKLNALTRAMWGEAFLPGWHIRRVSYTIRDFQDKVGWHLSVRPANGLPLLR